MKESLFLSHLNADGEARMVPVGAKEPSRRRARALCAVEMKPGTLRLLESGSLKKGDAFTVAKVAAILAVKKTAEVIPLCHPIPLEHIEIRFSKLPEGKGIAVECEVQTTAKTGVEMEALHGALIAALTLYDMAKSSDPGMILREARLIEKTGGKRDYVDARGYPDGK